MSAAAGGLARFGLIALLALALGALLLFPASPAGAQSGSGTVDYDTDGDNLIEVSNLAQLNAIRYDVVGWSRPPPPGRRAQFAITTEVPPTESEQSRPNPAIVPTPCQRI